jgi:uncharacterized protein
MKAVSEEMQGLIRSELAQLAKDEGALILFAIESGSRAWGFHSPDSDYDVRFVYARPVDWHLSLGKKRDVIERPISGDLDLSGWDIGKALGLALKSNTVIAEWLQSPITYAEVPEIRAELTAFCADTLDRHAVTWHYRSLLKTQLARAHNEGGEVRLKRFFYAVRPALALRWMRVNSGAMPPMDMARLMESADLDDHLIRQIDDLIAQKKLVREKAHVAVETAGLDALIADELASAEAYLAKGKPLTDLAVQKALANALNARLARLAGA